MNAYSNRDLSYCSKLLLVCVKQEQYEHAKKHLYNLYLYFYLYNRSILRILSKSETMRYNTILVQLN